MYFYLSFLRPPPVVCGITSPVNFTPQITNDLRTEFYEVERDIFCSWQAVGSPAARTVPTKLTTWKGAQSAYKALSVPLPKPAKVGQSWRLNLFCPPLASAEFHVTDTACVPIGVSSLPISVIGPKSRVLDTSKQDEIERTLVMPRQRVNPDDAVPPAVRCVTIRERTSYDLDKKVWDSGVAVSGWFVDLMTREASGHSLLIKNTLLAPSGCRIIELGAGTGLASIMLAVCLAESGARATIVATDLDSAAPLIEHNIESNGFTGDAVQVISAVLNWNEEIPRHVAPPFQIILMSDVTYNTASFPALLNTMEALERASEIFGVNPLFLLAYKERDPGEKDLWRMAEERGFILEHISDIAGHGGNPVEIWLGRYRPTSG